MFIVSSGLLTADDDGKIQAPWLLLVVRLRWRSTPGRLL